MRGYVFFCLALILILQLATVTTWTTGPPKAPDIPRKAHWTNTSTEKTSTFERIPPTNNCTSIRRLMQLRPITIGCLGDSITQGTHGKGKPFPAHLEEALREVPSLKHVVVKGYGHSGATLMNGTKLPYTKTKEWTTIQGDIPDVVVLLLGTNDSKRKYWKLFPRAQEKFRNELNWMISVLQGLPSHPLVVLGHPPPVFKSIDTIDNGTLVNQIFPVQLAVAKEVSLPLFSLYAPLNRKQYFVDGVHPTDKGRHIIAGVVKNALLDCFNL